MDDKEKPFACNFSGCGQRFSNSDHLAVHEQHHTLHVKFPGRAADALLVDQTPTPTRFLKLVDETGLFDALKGDELQKSSNPFDLDFKEAALKNSQTSQSVSQPVYQVTQPVADQESTGNSVGTSSNEKSVMTTVKTLNSSETCQLLVQPGVLPPKSVLSSFKPPATVPASSIASPINIGTVVIPVAPPTGLANPTADFPVASVPIGLNLANSPKVATVNGKFDLKQQIKHNLVAQNPGIVSQAIAHAQTREDSLQENVSSPDMNKPAGRRSRTRTDDGDPDTKRKRFLERNRAAATRCREKRKQWIVGLEKKAEGMASQNTQLQQEVLFLKNEVAQLKSLLLAHKDCPVTVAQQEQMKQLQASSTGSLAATTTLSTSPQALLLLTKSSDVTSLRQIAVATVAKQEEAEQVATTALAAMARQSNQQLMNLPKLNTTGVN